MELRDALRAFGYPQSLKETKALLDNFDTNENYVFERDEFFYMLKTMGFVSPQVQIATLRVSSRYTSRRRVANGPGTPCPSETPSISTTGITKVLADVMKASSASWASAKVKLRSSTSICTSWAKRRTAARVMPCRISVPR